MFAKLMKFHHCLFTIEKKQNVADGLIVRQTMRKQYTHHKHSLREGGITSLNLFLGGFMAREYYFTHFEPSQLLSGAKTGDLQEKRPDHPQAELGLSHI